MEGRLRALTHTGFPARTSALFPEPAFPPLNPGDVYNPAQMYVASSTEIQMRWSSRETRGNRPISATLRGTRFSRAVPRRAFCVTFEQPKLLGSSGFLVR